MVSSFQEANIFKAFIDLQTERRFVMIKLTRLNKIEKFWVNEDRIEFIEETPDTFYHWKAAKRCLPPSRPMKSSV